MNKVILTGYLTRDAEVKRTKADKAYTRTGIAVNRTFGKDREADFFNLVAFGKTAEFIGKYFKKGSKIFIEGQLRMDKYQDKDGNNRTSVDIWVDAVDFMGGKKDSDGSSGDDSNYRRNNSNQIDEEEYPF